VLESELREARVFVDEFKARLRERCGIREGKRRLILRAIAQTKKGRGHLGSDREVGRRFGRLQWGFMKHDGQVPQEAASNYGILMRKLHANVESHPVALHS
jgi:hypothetical protein